MAWEVYRRTFEWEEVARVSPDESTFEQQQAVNDKSASDRNKNIVASDRHKVVAVAKFDQKPPVSSNAVPSAPENKFPNDRRRARDRIVVRPCTNLSHLLTLRSQGIKMGCSTVCGECAREISWEELNRK